ncbi:hypothetical protein [Nocardia sp. NBC_01327]|uniref:hypothetical protein n=1 Tax=Nocardia sp. NBC_01327 TaxID=2903593 RepID=UPI002E10AFC0|nr:hypothetical protein OG326_17565 [Nocardia sp. NBC_01327]
MSSDRNPLVSLPFAIVREGYDRDQVLNYFDRCNAELRFVAADRDAAAAEVTSLAERLRDVQAALESVVGERDRAVAQVRELTARLGGNEAGPGTEQ